MRTIKDKFLREIDYLRISLTDNCNLRCIYCMPGRNVKFTKEKLTSEEVIKIIKASEKLGIKKVRFTGGEPLVRKDLIDIVRETNRLKGIEDICITTNGMLLLDKIYDLKENGLSRVNISLDTLNKEKYKQITRGGDIDAVLKSIYKCLELGIKVKLNVVIIKGLNDDEILDLMNITRDKNIDVRFIELMPIGEGNNFNGISNEEIIKLLKGSEYDILEHQRKDGPASYIRLKDGKGKIGFISALSNCFCEKCNRIRVTSDGMLKGCLNWKAGVNLKNELQKGISDDEIKELIKKSIYNKPEKYLFKKDDKNKEIRFMNQIGG